jgi:hypothetical protein
MQSHALAQKRPRRTRPLMLLYRNTEVVEQQQIAAAILLLFPATIVPSDCVNASCYRFDSAAALYIFG